MRSFFLVSALALSALITPAVADACCPPDPPQPVVWAENEIVNAIPAGNDLSKRVLTWAWDSGGMSIPEQALTRSGYVEFTITGEPGLQRAFGLNAVNEGTTPGDIDFGVLLWADGRVWICESCVIEAAPGAGDPVNGYLQRKDPPYQVNDRVRVEIKPSDTSGYYDINYVLIRGEVELFRHEHEMALEVGQFSLRVDAALCNKYATITDAVICQHAPETP